MEKQVKKISTLKGLVKQEQDHCKHLKIHSDAYKKMSEEGKTAVEQLTKQGKELEEKMLKLRNWKKVLIT